MSGITLGSFERSARLDLEGTIRIAKGTEDQLVNKGTLGNRICSWFQNTFGALDPTRQQRQEQARTAFREALVGKYGEDIAKLAFDSELGRGEKLTGARLTRAIENAKTIANANRITNTSAMNSLLPLSQGGPLSESLLNVAQGLNIEPLELTESELGEYEMRFRLRVTSESDRGRIKLQPERIREIARETLDEVHKLHQAGQLPDAIEARDRLTRGLKGMLIRLAGDQGAGETMRNLEALISLAVSHTIAETGAFDNEDIRRLTEAALGQALTELAQEDPELLGRAQRHMLDRDSPVRALYAKAQEELDGGQVSPRQRRGLGLSQSISEMLVRGVGKERGPQAPSIEDDLRVLRNEPGDLTPFRLEQAGRAVTSMLERMQVDPVSGTNFVIDLKTEFSEIDDDGNVTWSADRNGNPAWNSTAMLELLEQEVLTHATSDRITISLAIDNFRAAIQNDKTLPPGLQEKLGAGLDAIEEEFKLLAHLRAKEGFAGLKQEDIWRLFSGNRLVEEGKSKWDVEHREQGSLAGMQRAFRLMLEGRSGLGDEPVPPLTVDDLENFHLQATQNTFRGNLLGMTYKPDWMVAPDEKDGYRQDAVIQTGYRTRDTSLRLEVDAETTHDGRQELQAFAQPGENGERWVREVNTGIPNEYTLYFNPGDTRERAGEILGRYYGAIGEAQTANEKRQLIAGTVQELYRSHLFEDGNSRTVLFTVMNRMLLDAGLSPAILPKPRAAAGYSRDQFAQEILKGQAAFRCLKFLGSTAPSLNAMEQQLRFHVEQDGAPLARAIGNFRHEISESPDITDEFRQQCLARLDAIEEREFVAPLDQRLLGLQEEQNISLARSIGLVRQQIIDNQDYPEGLKSKCLARLDTIEDQQIVAPLEQRVQDLQKRQALTLFAAIDYLRTRIGEDPDYFDGLKLKCLARLDEIEAAAREIANNEAEAQLYEQLQGIPQFAQVKRDDIWRLFANGKEQLTLDERPGELTSSRDLVRKLGPGSLAGMDRAFGRMLSGFQDNVPLTTQHILDINQSGPNPGFREGPTELTIAHTGFVDIELLDEIIEKDPWFQGGRIGGDRTPRTRPDDPGHMITISLPGKSHQECVERIDAILETYRRDIAGAQDQRDKLLVIGKAVQDLYSSQIFPEGERQSTVFAVMNRMLLENGLDPGVITDPLQLVGLRAPLSRQAMMQAQNVFRILTTPIEE